MSNKATALTKSQHRWLSHIQRCESQNQSYSVYAKAHGLSLQGFYNARSVLRQKGLLSTPPANRSDRLVPVTTVGVDETGYCTLQLPNGMQFRWDQHYDPSRLLSWLQDQVRS